MYYFDNKTLQQYIDQGVDLKVSVGNDWFTVADLSDLQDPVEGIGYDHWGSSHYFDYRDIVQIKNGNRLFTLDQLNAQMSGQTPENKDKKDTKPKEPKEDDFPEEESDQPTSKEKNPDLSWFSPMYQIGRDLLKEAKRRKMNANHHKTV